MNVLPCREAERCKNSPQLAGESRTQCHWCRLAPGNAGHRHHFWRPCVKGSFHPVLEREKHDRSRARRARARSKRASSDRQRRRTLQQAERAERQTEKQIIRATKNSGRSHRDGDHCMGSQLLTLDTKLQSKRLHPLVQLPELDKVREDSRRAGTLYGGLVLRNRNGRGVVVLDEDDFAGLIAHSELRK